MENKQKYIAIAVVVIVVVAIVAVAAVSLLGNDDDDDGSVVESQLLVYGNADGNYAIDQNDLDIMNDIIAGDASLDDYPMADANCDGVVDESDIAIVEALIAGESTSMWVYCIGMDDEYTYVEISYPLRDFVVQGTNNDSLVCETGAAVYCAGYFYIYDNAHVGLVNAGAVDLGGTARGVSEAAWQNFMTLDAGLENGVGAIIADAGSSALSNYYDAITAADIPLLRFSVSDTYDSISAALTIGFICGGEVAENAYEYAVKCWDAFDYISDRLSGLSDDERKVFVSITMGRYIAHTESDYTHKAEYAGGVNIGDVNEEFAATYSGTGSTQMQSNEALSNYDDYLDFIFSFRTVDYGTSMEEFVTDEWEEYMSYYETLDSYEDFVIINGMLPMVCQTAYAAAIMYPDLISMEWADELLLSFIEDSPTMGDYGMDDIITVFTYDDYMEYISSQ